MRVLIMASKLHNAFKMLSNNTLFETRLKRLDDGLIFVEKGFGVYVQRMLSFNRVITLAEILSKIFVKKNG